MLAGASMTAPEVLAYEPAATSQAALSQEGEMVAQAITEELNGTEMRNAILSDGTFDDYKVTRTGGIITVTFRFVKAVNLQDLSAKEKSEMTTEITKSLRGSMGAEAVKYLKSLGITIRAVFKDHYGHQVANSI